MSKIFILLYSTFWLALASLAELQAAAAPAPDLSGAKENDPRLHADGKGWRLDQARITDPTRPRVLWTYAVPEPGEYRVEIDYALHKRYAGLPIDILIDHKKQLSFNTEVTGGDNTYQKKVL